MRVNSPKNNDKKNSAIILLYALIFLVFIGLVFMNYFLKEEKKKEVSEKIGLSKFNSIEEFRLLLNKSIKQSNERGDSHYDYRDISYLPLKQGNLASASMTPSSTNSQRDYSRTNIQVEGVDEADIIKNDGKYLYVLSGNYNYYYKNNAKLNIVEAYPAGEMKIVGHIDFKSDEYPLNFYLSKDKLVVIGNGLVKRKSVFCEDDPYYIYCICEGGKKEIVLCNNESCENDKLSKVKCNYSDPSYSGASSYPYSKDYSYPSVVVYDISDKRNPRKVQEYIFDGEIVDSRLIDDNLYLITKEYMSIDSPKLPVIYENGLNKNIRIGDIYYSVDEYDYSYYFTIVSSINIDKGQANSKAYMINTYSDIYVSDKNIYISEEEKLKDEEHLELLSKAFKEILPKEHYKKIENIKKDKDIKLRRKLELIQELFYDYVSNLEGKEMEEFSERAREVLANLSKDYLKLKKTKIHKIGIEENGQVSYVSSGAVPGRILNQFSMDEYKGNLRVFTTTGSDSWLERDKSLNHLYILDKDMKIIGSVEDLAEGERIYSSRFLGDVGYVVTFRQIDPLYAIDLKDPTNPKVLGYLKVPGFSNYLHFLSKDKLIGVGYDTQENGIRGRAKVSLFDVSDPYNIREASKILIGNSSSINLEEDHKAFMLDKKKKILAIPFNYYIYAWVSGREPFYYPYRAFYGVLVFDLSNDEIKLIGNITHQDLYRPKYGPAKDEPIGATRNYSYENYTKVDENKWEKMLSYSYSYTDERDYVTYYTDSYMDKLEGGVNYFPSNYEYSIKRSAFIEEVLYTISGIYIKANNIRTLDYINHIEFNSEIKNNTDQTRPPLKDE